MSDTVEDIRCSRCDGSVDGYEHRVQFTFVDGERLQTGGYAVINCGCEILDYELEVDYSRDGKPTAMIDTLRKDTILVFNDAGPHNDNWHQDLEEDDSEYDV